MADYSDTKARLERFNIAARRAAEIKPPDYGNDPENPEDDKQDSESEIDEEEEEKPFYPTNPLSVNQTLAVVALIVYIVVTVILYMDLKNQINAEAYERKQVNTNAAKGRENIYDDYKRADDLQKTALKGIITSGLDKKADKIKVSNLQQKLERLVHENNNCALECFNQNDNNGERTKCINKCKKIDWDPDYRVNYPYSPDDDNSVHPSRFDHVLRKNKGFD